MKLLLGVKGLNPLQKLLVNMKVCVLCVTGKENSLNSYIALQNYNKTELFCLYSIIN